MFLMKNLFNIFIYDLKISLNLNIKLICSKLDSR